MSLLHLLGQLLHAPDGGLREDAPGRLLVGQLLDLHEQLHPLGSPVVRGLGLAPAQLTRALEPPAAELGLPPRVLCLDVGVVLQQLLARLDVPQRPRDEHVPDEAPDRVGHARVVHVRRVRPQALGLRDAARRPGPGLRLVPGGEGRAEAVPAADGLGQPHVHDRHAVDEGAFEARAGVAASVEREDVCGQRRVVEQLPDHHGVQGRGGPGWLVLVGHDGGLLAEHEPAGLDLLLGEETMAMERRVCDLCPRCEARGVEVDVSGRQGLVHLSKVIIAGFLL